MKKTAQIISYLFHPLLMPSLGLLIILNSGTYLALLDPAAKRAIMFVMALGTLVFPLMMLPVIQYRSLVMRDGQASTKGEQMVPQVIILILYIITYVYFKRLPLSQVIHSYVLAVMVTFFILLILNLRLRVSIHAAALGGLTGLILVLIFLYDTPLQGILMLSFLASGLVGSSRLIQGDHWAEVLGGFFLGLVVIVLTILVC